MANEDQHHYWNAEGGAPWVEHQDRFDLMLAPYGDLVVDALAVRAGERVLDLGCGCGATTRLVAARLGASGAVVGVDVSAPMLGRARAMAGAEWEAAEAGLADVRFEQCDVQTDDLGGPFDAALSRFGVMFFDDPVAAFANVRSALVPGGRLAFVCWQHPDANPLFWEAGRAAAHLLPPPEPFDPRAPGPFGLADPARIEEVLGAAGFASVEVRAEEREVVYGGREGMAGALDQAALHLRRALADLDAAARAEVLDVVRAVLERRWRDGAVRYPSAAWLVTAVR